MQILLWLPMAMIRKCKKNMALIILSVSNILMASKLCPSSENRVSTKWRTRSGKSNPWTAEENELLCDLVQEYGLKNWTKIAEFFLNRTAKQCRARYLTVLNPNINHEHFTEKEDQKIITLFNEYGTQWAQIAKYLLGRTDNSIKNRWYNILKKRQNNLKKERNVELNHQEMFQSVFFSNHSLNSDWHNIFPDII